MFGVPWDPNTPVHDSEKLAADKIEITKRVSIASGGITKRKFKFNDVDVTHRSLLTTLWRVQHFYEYLNDDIVNRFLSRLASEHQNARRWSLVDSQVLGSWPQKTKAQKKKIVLKKMFTRAVSTQVCELDNILFPVHIDNHWILVVADFSTSTLLVFNSIKSTNRSGRDYKLEDIQEILEYIDREDERVNTFIVNHRQRWKIQLHAQCPKQKDAVSCGVHVLLNAMYFIQDLPIPLSYPVEIIQLHRDKLLEYLLVGRSVTHDFNTIYGKPTSTQVIVSNGKTMVEIMSSSDEDADE
jgi:hypothetical protein